MRSALAPALTLALSLFLSFWSAPAHAWWVDDPLHRSCHERITHAALLQAGYVAPPPALSKDDGRLRASLQFDASPYDANIYALSLVMGVRWPDAQGAPDFDFYQLAEVHNDPAGQGPHCLRAPGHDGAGPGDEAALRDCRSHIERHYWAALKTLDAAGEVNPAERELIAEFIPFVGRAAVPVSGFYVNAGIALHAVEDSFTHSYRTSDYRRLVHVFNWSDQVRGTIDESRDGHGHEGLLDDCEDRTPGNDVAARMGATVAAAADFLRALNQPGDRAVRQQRLDRFFADWMTYQPGCDLANEYCDSPLQRVLRDSGKSDVYGSGGCAAAGWSVDPSGAPLLIVAVAAALLVATTTAPSRRRRRRSDPRRVLSTAPALWAAAALLAPSAARAHPPGGPTQAFTDGPRGYRSEVRASLSVQNPAYAVGFTGAWAWRRAEAGGFVEINPWYSVEKRYTQLGATNVGAFAHYLHPIRRDVRVRAGLGLGVSILNQDWYGTDAGNLGLYLNLRLLGVVWNLSDGIALTVDGFDVALPAPQLTGWPILYAQHRLSFGVQF